MMATNSNVDKLVELLSREYEKDKALLQTRWVVERDSTTGQLDRNREVAPGHLHLPEEFHNHLLVGTARMTLKPFGFPKGVVIQFIDVTANWMYCEADAGEVNLHAQDMIYGPNGHDWGGTYIYDKYHSVSPLAFDLGNFQFHSLPARVDIPNLQSNLGSFSRAILGQLLTPDASEDKIIKGIRLGLKKVGDSSPTDDLKLIKYHLGGWLISWGGRDYTVAEFVQAFTALR